MPSKRDQLLQPWPQNISAPYQPHTSCQVSSLVEVQPWAHAAENQPGAEDFPLDSPCLSLAALTPSSPLNTFREQRWNEDAGSHRWQLTASRPCLYFPLLVQLLMNKRACPSFQAPKSPNASCPVGFQLVSSHTLCSAPDSGEAACSMVARDMHPNWGLLSNWIIPALPGLQVQTTTNMSTTLDRKSKKKKKILLSAQLNTIRNCCGLCRAFLLSLDFFEYQTQALVWSSLINSSFQFRKDFWGQWQMSTILTQ